MNKLFLLLLLSTLIFPSCSSNEHKLEKKGFQVNEINEDESGKKIVGLSIDSLSFKTRPRGVLLTKSDNHRLTPIYKLNFNKTTNDYSTGSNAYHRTWHHEYDDNNNSSTGNNWNGNFMPGFEALYGYNLVNVSLFNDETKQSSTLFEKPALIKTLYFPAYSNDTLNFKPVNRKNYLVSVYDEDSNKDGFINAKDLRRFYVFDINGANKQPLVPINYSVMSSEYDEGKDYMYVFAKLDENKNGQMEQEEPVHIFWINLNNPSENGLQYK